MQLKTMLIGTGTLAIAAASLTLGRGAAAIPATGSEKRSDVLLGLKLLRVLKGDDQAKPIIHVPPDILHPGDIVQTVGYDGKLKGRKSGAYA